MNQKNQQTNKHNQSQADVNIITKYFSANICSAACNRKPKWLPLIGWFRRCQELEQSHSDLVTATWEMSSYNQEALWLPARLSPSVYLKATTSFTIINEP